MRFLYAGGRATFADKAAGERILTGSGLDWTLAYPVLLTNEPASDRVGATDLADLDRLPGLPRISRADVAGFLLTAGWSIRYTVRYTAVVEELYQWPAGPAADLRDGLTAQDVAEALYAPLSLRMDNRVPAQAPTFLAVCAPTEQQRLIIIVCTRTDADEPWTIRGARDATMNERAMWRKYTS
jgi:hypothetical protein